MLSTPGTHHDWKSPVRQPTELVAKTRQLSQALSLHLRQPRPCQRLESVPNAGLTLPGIFLTDLLRPNRPSETESVPDRRQDPDYILFRLFTETFKAIGLFLSTFKFKSREAESMSQRKPSSEFCRRRRPGSALSNCTNRVQKCRGRATTKMR